MIHGFNYTEKCYFFYQLHSDTQVSDMQVYVKLPALACSVGHINNGKDLIFLVILLL